MTKPSRSNKRKTAKSVRHTARSSCQCCWVQKADEAGCKLRLPRPGDWACLSGTAYQANHSHDGKLCDYIVFWSGTGFERVGVVELKGRNPRASEVQQQLQAGARLAEALAEDAQPPTAFVAAVLHKKVNAMGIKALGSKRVRFMGRRYRIKVKACGHRLAELY